MKKETGTDTEIISPEQKVEFLKDPGHYPEPTQTVELVDTHMSWVFLTDEFVYKLKKPYRYDHLRLNTVKARHQNCVEEVRLNRRLAEEVYLGAVPLALDKKGGLTFDEGDEIVDWLVKMKRLPSGMMLDRRIKAGTGIPENNLEPPAGLLYRFYSASPPVYPEPEAFLGKMVQGLDEYRNALLDPEFGLPAHSVDSIYRRLLTYLHEQDALFRSRIEEDRIVEGHGDLKPEHICLDPVAVIDCLEFDRELRVMDVIDDLAFLSVECDRLGAPWVGHYFLNYYIDRANDRPPDSLVEFYKSHKAYIRALLTIRHIKEPAYKGDPKWKKRTITYLELAGSYIG